MTALPADVARALQGLRKCGCGRIFRTDLPNKLRCDECVQAAYGAAKTQCKQPVLKPRSLGEY